MSRRIYAADYQGAALNFFLPPTTYMPACAFGIAQLMSVKDIQAAFVADLVKAVGEPYFEHDLSDNARQTRIGRTFSHPVEVDGWVLTIEGGQQKHIYEKTRRVVRRPGTLATLPDPPEVAIRPAPISARQEYPQAIPGSHGILDRPPGFTLPTKFGEKTWGVDPLEPEVRGSVEGIASDFVHEGLKQVERSLALLGRKLDTAIGDFNKRLAALELAMMDGASPLPADAAVELARVETEFKKRTFDLGVAQNRILARLERLDPQPPVAD